MPRIKTPEYADPSAELLTRRQAATILGLCPKTLSKWHWRGMHTDALPVIKVGARDVRYRRSDVMRVVEQGIAQEGSADD